MNWCGIAAGSNNGQPVIMNRLNGIFEARILYMAFINVNDGITHIYIMYSIIVKCHYFTVRIISSLSTLSLKLDFILLLLFIIQFISVTHTLWLPSISFSLYFIWLYLFQIFHKCINNARHCTNTNFDIKLLWLRTETVEHFVFEF